MAYDPVTGRYSYAPTAPRAPIAPRLSPPSPGNSGYDQAPAYGTVTPGNPATTQSLGQMARESWDLARDMMPGSMDPRSWGWGEAIGNVLGLGGVMGAGMFGALGDRTRGVSIGALNQDPQAARIGSGIPSQQTTGALAQAKAEAQLGIAQPRGFFDNIFGMDPQAVDKTGVTDRLGSDYTGGNYTGSMDKTGVDPSRDPSPSSREGGDDATKRKGGRIGALKRYREAH